MRALWWMLTALAVLSIAYRYYSAFIAAKVLALDDSRITPAHTQRDGSNYHPTNKWVLFGHHFAAISGAGPLIGPVLADFGLRFVFIVLLLAGMSFLGFGVQPPNADWGSLVRENMAGLHEGAPAVLMPALAIASLTIGVNLAIDSFGARRGGGGDAG